MILRPILDITEVWFIHGNHDSDRSAYWQNLHGSSLAYRSLHGRVVEIAGHRIAGLGGTFESQVWLPGSPDTGIQNHGDFLEHLALKPQHADIIATKRQHALSAIYPDDYFTLAVPPSRSCDQSLNQLLWGCARLELGLRHRNNTNKKKV